MNTDLEQFLLEQAKGYLKSLSDEQFLALTCNLTTLHDGLIRLVHNQSFCRQFRAPNRVTAAILSYPYIVLPLLIAQIYPDKEEATEDELVRFVDSTGRLKLIIANTKSVPVSPKYYEQLSQLL